MARDADWEQEPPIDTVGSLRVDWNLFRPELWFRAPTAAERIAVDIHQTISLSTLLGFALFANIPLGYLREGAAKYSVRWFVYIHLSIPFIIALRLAYGFSWRVIPLTLGCAVAGQMVGGRARRRARR